MKQVTIYTDGVMCCAHYMDVPTRSPLTRQLLGDDTAPSVCGDCL